MIRLSGIRLTHDYKDGDIAHFAAKKLRIDENIITGIRLYKLSVDARDKNDVHFVATADIEISADEKSIIKNSRCKTAEIVSITPYIFKKCAHSNKKIIVVGAGPAGLFAAYILAKSGMSPVIIERGGAVDKRVDLVQQFIGGGELDTECNIQFGEGGAGTFSDGKLNTGIKDTRIRTVLETFVKFGAPKDILWQAKPHIGTDILRKVVVNMREEIIALGGEFHFDTKLTKLNIIGGRVYSVNVICGGEEREIACDDIILAIGHSARDTFAELYRDGVEMISKPFAVGVRIEHSQSMIDHSQYGNFAGCGRLSAADYKLSVHLPSGRGVYTFCMCPGGFVVAATSEKGAVVTNGMSNRSRDNINANSAVLVGVDVNDYYVSSPLDGIEFQRKIERAAYKMTGGYKAPCETLGSFLYDKDNEIGAVLPSYKPGVTLCKIGSIFPDFITNSLRSGILLMERRLKGFADENAVITAPETRSSSPVRILRGKDYQSAILGLYPCGEGAGYAGGITSSAVDGIKCAEAIISKYSDTV